MATKKTTKQPKTRTMAQAFDEWMRLFVADPQRFAAQFQDVAEHARGRAKGKSATEYGIGCAGMLRRLMKGGTA